MASPDYSELFDSEKFSDVSIQLAEGSEAAPAKSKGRSKRKRADDSTDCTPDQTINKALHGHRVVLYGASSFCKTKLDSWSSSKAGQPEILITVPAGQLEAGELLVKGMYAAQPDLSGCSQSQLLQLLLLADMYGVSKVLKAVPAAFSTIATSDLEWDTFTAVYNLPPGCADLDACKGIFAAAGQKLQEQLGDLELVWADKQGQKQQLLLQLPHSALLQLLQDPGTRVASENTVFYTIERWQQQQHPTLTRAKLELQQLVQQVRMQHCTQLYVATVMSRSPLASLCFGSVDLAVASTYSTIGLAAADHIQALQESCPEVAKYPAWSLPQRPASAMQQLDLEWQLPLEKVKAAVQQHLQDTSKDLYIFEGGHVWQGLKFALNLACNTTTVDAGTFSDVSVMVEAMGMPVGGVRRITYQAGAVKVSGQRIATSLRIDHFMPGTLLGRKLLVIADLSSWDQLEAKLRERQLVHADSCLHLTGKVTAML